MTTESKWWQHGIVYQIYPRSYQDTNGDGVGDLFGIIQRLDYLKSLNIDAIWISPIFPSPMHDFGYDVADYTDIHPMFGTLADFDKLLAEAHQRDLKILLDLVPNHTSDEHAWFVESRSSRDNPKRDWYIWRDPKPDGSPPNNWLSFFGGPAWTLDQTTGQYYLHQFVTQQPELNYRHPEVLPAMLDCMRFWLDRGVDGFRVDVIWLMIKDEQLRDEPPNQSGTSVQMGEYGKLNHIYTKDLPEVHGLIKQMRTLVDEYDDRVMIGEIYEPFEVLVQYYGKQADECHLPFNFHLIISEWDAVAVRQRVEEYEAHLPEGAWPNWVLGNHDQHRVATRTGYEQARMANMLLLTLRGTPTCYYGDELGMEDGYIPPEFIQDPPALNQPELADVIGRDPERTPMQWDDTTNAGFTVEGVTSWLPVTENYKTRNVALQLSDSNSMLSYFQQLTTLRRAEPALNRGDYATVKIVGDDLFAYRRDHAERDSFLIVLNFGASKHQLDLSHVGQHVQIALSTDLQRTGEVDLATLTLHGNEGLVLRLG
ncbi:alpha-amylase family glycosyl hydrolase [Anaerolineales bacterium HSG25]|nr:alpha-amylase family glycosyl hydrolase [Anaerolineales bacterium HSG25]